MNRLSRLSLGQRVVLVIGFAAALVAVGEYCTTADGVTGWTGYAPLRASNAPFAVPGGMAPWVRLLLWFALVAIWVAASLPLMRSRPVTPAGAPGRASAKGVPGSPA